MCTLTKAAVAARVKAAQKIVISANAVTANVNGIVVIPIARLTESVGVAVGSVGGQHRATAVHAAVRTRGAQSALVVNV
eukprot:3167500-Lingulodinium_polyedra.AAC.1